MISENSDETMGLAIAADDVKVIKDLLLHFVDDIQRGIPLADAGWVSWEQSITRDLSKDGLCDVEDRGVRLSVSVFDHKDLLSRLDDEGQNLLLIYKDILKAAELEQVLTRVTNKSVQACVFSLGLERMLQSSEFPIAPERALQQGIGPDEWQIQVSHAIPELALTIARKFWNIENWSDVLQQLKRSNLPAPEIKEDHAHQFEKVKRVLEWDKAVAATGEEPTKALGLIWYADDLIGMNQIQAPEGIMLVQKKAWSMVEADLGRTSAEIEKEVEDMIEKIDLTTRESDREYHTRPIASWVDIIRLPW